MTAKEETETVSAAPESSPAESLPSTRNPKLTAARERNGLGTPETTSFIEVDREGLRRSVSGQSWGDKRVRPTSKVAQSEWVKQADLDPAFKSQREQYQAALRDGEDLTAHEIRKKMDAAMTKTGLDYMTRFAIWQHLATTAFDPENQPEPKRIGPERHIRNITVSDPDKAEGPSR